MGRRLVTGLVVMVAATLLVPAAAAQTEEPTPSPNGDGEVVNGVNAAPGEFPFLVGLLRRGVANTFQAQFCGGTLVGPRRVITAAHCVVDSGAVTPASQLDVLVGTHLLNGSGRRIRVVGVHVHPRFNEGTLRNDLAALDLAQRADIGNARTVGYARPNQRGLAGDNSPVTVAGWGQVNAGTPAAFTQILQKANIRTYPRSTCDAFYPAPTRPNSYSHVTQICAGLQNIGACHGDSGGPLVRRFNGRRYLVGIVSFGNPAAAGGCATAPEIYTRVSAFSLGNDHFAAPRPLPNAGGRSTTSTYLASKQLGEPVHGRNRGGASAWWRWRSTRTGFVTISTVGSNFDTLLGVYRGGALNRLTRVATNDDAPGTLASRVRFRAQRNVVYRIAVDGYAGRFGNVVLNVRRG